MLRLPLFPKRRRPPERPEHYAARISRQLRESSDRDSLTVRREAARLSRRR